METGLEKMLCNRLVIRPSTSTDKKAIRKIELAAFGRPDEANLVDRLIPAPEYTLSLLALCDDIPVGHILLSEISASVKALALAPLAVLPAYREMQVGSGLVRAGLAEARKAGFKAVFVLGDRLYYERFGFSSRAANAFKVKWQGQHFMACELNSGALEGKSGKLEYPEAFLEL